MMIEGKELLIARVERITKSYDKAGRIIQEQWEYFFPKDEGGKIDFGPKLNNRK
jgi:hypothetical protein